MPESAVVQPLEEVLLVAAAAAVESAMLVPLVLLVPMETTVTMAPPEMTEPPVPMLLLANNPLLLTSASNANHPLPGLPATPDQRVPLVTLELPDNLAAKATDLDPALLVPLAPPETLVNPANLDLLVNPVPFKMSPACPVPLVLLVLLVSPVNLVKLEPPTPDNPDLLDLPEMLVPQVLPDKLDNPVVLEKLVNLDPVVDAITALLLVPLPVIKANNPVSVIAGPQLSQVLPFYLFFYMYRKQLFTRSCCH